MRNAIKFLGTAGARVVVAKQLRASGGIWLSLDGTQLLIDPGPGCRVRCLNARPKLDPTTLDGIVLSHKHLDHAADINVMMEAMTLGGYEKKGKVLVPQDALSGKDPVIYRYLRRYVSEIEAIRVGEKHKIGNITIQAPIKHLHHEVETYGLILKGKKRTISYITDTKFFPGLMDSYEDDILIISVLCKDAGNLKIDHLCVDDVKKIIRGIRPRVTILTHFGLRMINARPASIAAELSRELKTKVVAARDGMIFPLA
ncbi:MAG: MBL fold metallo-hydrolase [Candidatus Margulisiibacteriota bacterium]